MYHNSNLMANHTTYPVYTELAYKQYKQTDTCVDVLMHIIQMHIVHTQVHIRKRKGTRVFRGGPV